MNNLLTGIRKKEKERGTDNLSGKKQQPNKTKKKTHRGELIYLLRC